MAREQNFLLGQGERLTSDTLISRGGSPKNPPYDFATARRRASTSLGKTIRSLQSLPSDACPNDQAVAVITLHPRFLSKSDTPDDLLARVGLHTVGSRSRRVKPDAWGVEKHGEDALTSELFVAGQRAAFADWQQALAHWTPDTLGADALAHLETIAAFEPNQKLKGEQPAAKTTSMMEIVLHNSGSEYIVSSFLKYAKDHGGEPIVDRRRDVHGLTFIPVRAPAAKLAELAAFSFVRVARSMPSLRPFRPGLVRRKRSFAVKLPVEAALDADTRAVIFDGGIPTSVRVPLSQWVNCIEPLGIRSPIPALEEHGLMVTSAFLFGPLRPGVNPPRPMCVVDHVRVLDDQTTGSDLEYYDVLARITKHLDDHPNVYKFVNISLGPNMAFDDDEVTLWTSQLDGRFAHQHVLATVAAGNDGCKDAAARLNRIQPPADGVNVLSVGATDRTDDEWTRADYSCVGPGRCPGVVKPDGLIFGGSDAEEFGILEPGGTATYEAGTSLASPYAMRTGAGVRAALDDRLTPLAIRALMIHRAQPHASVNWQERGWGRFHVDVPLLITCDDNEALVLYQGELPVGHHLRAKIPVPPGKLAGKVELSATLAIAPRVDPQHPGAYTRAGLEVALRPHSQRFTKPLPGKKQPAHPKTEAFFSAKKLYGAAESVLREDGHKWEPCIRATRSFNASSLVDPCFDIYYHHRDGGGADSSPYPIPYALVVGLRATKVKDLYNQVVRAYRALAPLKPRTRMGMRT
jgi:hypothetical protein